MKAFTFNLLNLHLHVQNMKLFQIGQSFHVRIEVWMDGNSFCQHGTGLARLYRMYSPTLKPTADPVLPPGPTQTHYAPLTPPETR